MTCRSFPYASSTIGVIFFNPPPISSWARSMSYCACRPIQAAGVVPNALASRKAVSAVSAVCPLTSRSMRGARHADYAGYGIGRKLHRHEKLLAEHFTGMDSRKLLAHQ